MIRILSFALITVFSISGWSLAVNPWANVPGPTHDGPEILGFYSNGCLKGAVQLVSPGDGFQTMRPSRRRDYGHPRLIGFLKTFARDVRAAGNLGTVLIGDMAQPRGGPTLSSHASHEVGLDVDIWYLTVPAGEVLTTRQREEMPAPSLLTPDLEHLNAQTWSPDKMELLRIAASQPFVQRIFVNPVIKKEICRHFAGRAWVHKLRPWYGHDDHFHVRLTCPPEDAACEGQEEQPPGDGCDETLDEWLTPEAFAKERDVLAHPGPPSVPHLPAACAAVLTEK